MRYLTLGEVVWLHREVVTRTGGAQGIRDLGALQSAIALPKSSFSGEELYPTVVEKAAVLCHSIVLGHPFVDGNKRAGHASMEVFLNLNGCRLVAELEEQEQLMLSLAAGNVTRDDLIEWLRTHVEPAHGNRAT
ncbi:MAG: type II toxin-antitoxin system death-on-curing family toxin [Planctomycetes bacterium]|nr:type II toxin-antitoxin system death-on-curing family toxin [Planctomycetota bacterium]